MITLLKLHAFKLQFHFIHSSVYNSYIIKCTSSTLRNSVRNSTLRNSVHNGGNDMYASQYSINGKYHCSLSVFSMLPGYTHLVLIVFS